MALDALGDLPEQLVARLPAEGVVDDLEPVDVHHGNGEPAFFALRRAHVLNEALVEQAAVGEAGERVVIGEVIELLRFRDMVERERDVAGELQQQLHLLVVEESDLPGVQGEHAYPFALDDKGQHDQGTDAALPALLLHLGARIVLYIVCDHGLLVLDGASRHSPSYGAALAHGERSRGEELLCLAAPGDRLHPLGFAVHYADPCHRELAGLDRSPAGSLEELVTIVHAHDEGVDSAEHRIHPVQAVDPCLRFLACGDVADDPLNIVVAEKFDADFGRETGAVPAPDHSFVQTRFFLADLCSVLRPFLPFVLGVGCLAV